MSRKIFATITTASLILTACNFTVSTNNTTDDEIADIDKSGKYKLIHGDKIVQLPDITQRQFGEQILNNTFKIEDIHLLDKTATTPAKISKEKDQDFGGNIYNNFILTKENDEVTGIILKAPKGMAMKDLLQKWKGKHRQVLTQAGLGQAVIYDTAPNDNYHVEVYDVEENVYQIALLRGEVNQKKFEPKVDVLNPSLKHQLLNDEDMSLKGVKPGMSREALFSRYGTPEKIDLFNHYDIGRYGDLGVEVGFGKVSEVVIFANDIPTDEFIKVWGEPDKKQKAAEAEDARYIYNGPNPQYSVEVLHEKGKVTAVQKVKNYEYKAE